MLYQALRDRRTVPPLIERHPELTVDDAYAVSLGFLARRRKDGERVVGKKIGVTSKAVQDMLGVHQPDFGFLTDWMHVEGDIDIDAKALIAPRAEAEIAFVLKNGLAGPGVTAAQVIAATEAIVPCFEIVDSRITDWKIGIVDTVADNASCGVYVLGNERLDPRGLDLPNLHVAVGKNGVPLSEGHGHAVQGDPAQAVAWLANTLGAYGVTLDAGDVILSGSLVPLAPAVKGDRFEMILSDAGGPIGRCVANFV
ncbi:MAG: fumarylacetoacetate hydrolase family protein [Sphingomonadales bacterium]|nr:fumarylacetoacetate hydrolase family protein [Sphingomonadales bacterium]